MQEQTKHRFVCIDELRAMVAGLLGEAPEPVIAQGTWYVWNLCDVDQAGDSWVVIPDDLWSLSGIDYSADAAYVPISRNCY